MAETIVYRFFEKTQESGVTVELAFDDLTFHILLPDGEERPEWTQLEFQRCPNCPLSTVETHCPAALAISHYLPAFAAKISHSKAVVEVETRNRIIVSKTTLQAAMASLIGLTLATCGCPRTQFLRPMARFHLPFADERETVFRSLSTWLLIQYICRTHVGEGHLPASFDDLKACYAEVSIVNAALAERLRAAVSRDAALNAVMILDSFALITPENIDGDFADIAAVFKVEAH